MRKNGRKNGRTAGRMLLTASVFALVLAAATISVSLLSGAALPAYAGTWRQTDSGWYYREAGKNVTGWKRIADETGARHWYYFGEDGRLVRNADTPDGFRVNSDGVFAGISQKGVEQAFAAAEKAKESAQQAYERNYYAGLRAKAAEEAARAAEEAAKAGNTGGPGVPDTEPEAGNGSGEGRKSGSSYVSLFERERYRDLLGKAPAQKLSGLRTGGMPAEFFMLCVAGETSGAGDFMSSIVADQGRAYGLCQYDYRFDLVDFLNYAVRSHPAVWRGAEAFLTKQNGDITLVENAELKQIFRKALLMETETALSDQLTFMRMLYWDDFAKEMNAAGFHLNDRNIAVQAALFSVNVNCGPQAEIFIRELKPDISDQEFLDRIYEIRNTIFAEQLVEGLREKGTSYRYLTAEPEMAADLMYGRIGLDSELDYGGGVEWYGNPF